MKYYFIIAAALMSFMCFTSPIMVQASEAEKTQTLTGTLTVDKEYDNDDNYVVVKVTLTVGLTDYYIVLDKIGKELAAKMDDREIKVVAVVTKKEVEIKDEDDNAIKSTELWLTVKSFKAIAQEESEDSEE